MAKPTGGLIAFDARGQLAKTIVYSSWRGRNYVRQYVIPGNPNTVGQQTQRSLFRILTLLWKTTPASMVTAWQAYAKGKPLTDRNGWLKVNLLGLFGRTDLTVIQPTVPVNGGFYVNGLTVTAGVGSVVVASADPILPTGWSVVSFQAVAIENALVTNIFLPLPWYAGQDVTSPYSVTITGLTAGTEYVGSGWFVFMKPDGTLAYSGAFNDVATPT